jgi:outer membrane protein
MQRIGTTMKTIASLALGSFAILACGAAQAAGENVVKFGLTEYTTHSQSNGISGPGVPPGADAETGNATTVIFVYERMFTPNIGLELVIGVPPTIHAKATGSVAFLGDDILSAKNVAPTLLLNYHFGGAGDAWRPYLGAGFNYTKFTDVKTKLPGTSVQMGDSWGWAVQGGISYQLNKEVSFFASIAALDVKSNVVATGATVLTTKIDFKPIVYSAGVAYQF